MPKLWNGDVMGSSGILADPNGDFSFESIYSESPSLPPKLAANMPSQSGLAGGLGDAFLPSVGHARLNLNLSIPTSAGVAVLGAAVLVRSWSAWAVSTLADKVGHFSPYTRKLDENSGASG